MSSSFASLLAQLNSRYEADVSRLTARCELLEREQRRLLQSVSEREAAKEDEQPKFLSVLSAPARTRPLDSLVPTWTGALCAEHAPDSTQLLLSCFDAEGWLSRCVLRISEWWALLEEPPRSGFIFNLLKSRLFRCFIWLVIVGNAVSITMMTDANLEDPQGGAPPVFQSVEYFCLAVYMVEIVLRLMCHRWYFFVNDSAGWNWLDFGLVLLSMLELALDAAGNESSFLYMRSLRACKVSKAFRIFRVMSAFQELARMLRSFRSSLVAMFWSLVLLYFLLFLGALVFAQGVSEGLSEQLFAESDEEVRIHFGTVGRTMLSLYMAVTGGNDWALYFLIMEEIGAVYHWLFVGFTFFFTFALVNILTALFVEKAVEAGRPDRDRKILEQRKKFAAQAEELRELFMKMDLDKSGRISFEEFVACMKDADIVSYMLSIGLEVSDAEVLFNLVADDEGELEIGRFVETCMGVKGHASALDMQKQLLHIARIADTLKAWELRFWPALTSALGSAANAASAASAAPEAMKEEGRLRL